MKFRRSAGVLALATIAVATTACLPPPPSGWVPPVVTATVAPDPVAAGQPFEIEVVATDPSTVMSLEIEVRPWYRRNPGNAALFPGLTCDASEFEPATSVTRRYTCVLPSNAPNGSWRLEAFAMNSRSDMYRGGTEVTFEVTGGSDDTSPPVLESASTSPAQVIVGEPFSATVRASDESFGELVPAQLSSNVVLPSPPGGSVAWRCDPATPTRESETVLVWEFTGCLIPAGSPAWTYAGGFQVVDTLGHGARMSFSFQAIDG